MSQPATSVNTSEPSPVGADISVTVVGGYLGSGKTTLVNHLLAAGTERLAVLVNDFGDVDIDAALIEQADGDTIALANGCICCSLVDGLAAALATIANLEPAPDRLVIEASGVADPATVAAYGHGPGFTLDAVVVLVDAETVRTRATDKYVGDTVLGQLRSADIVVANKADLITPAALGEVTDWLADRVDRAVVVTATEAQVDPAVLFGVTPNPVVSPGFRADPEGPVIHDRADDVFQNWTWVGDRPVTRQMVDELMGELPDTVVRAKGVVHLVGEERPHVLQRVGGRWSLRPARPGSPAAADRASRLVLIGVAGALDDSWLVDRLEA